MIALSSVGLNHEHRDTIQVEEIAMVILIGFFDEGY